MRFRKLPVITKKIVAGAMVMGLALCSIVFAAGYWSFSQQFERQYDASIRAVAAAARECLHPNDFKRYLEVGPDANYAQTAAILQDFVDKFGLTFLYVSMVESPDYKRITYIHDPVRKGSNFREYPLGYFEIYDEPEYNASAKRVFEKGETVVQHVEKTRSGSHIAAMMPVKDSTGKVVAVIGAEKSIQEYVSAKHRFMIFVITVEAVFALLSILLFGSFINKRFINPIALVTHEASLFAKNGGEPSDKLRNIRAKDEILTLARSVFQMETDIRNYIDNLSKVTAEKERFEAEVGVASRIQVAMLPKENFPDRKDFELFATMTPAKEVGGDLYDYFLLDDDHLLLTVGDVSGKGVPAALFMMVSRIVLRTTARNLQSVVETFEKANYELAKRNRANMFVTVWMGFVDLQTGRIEFASAGHNPPVIRHKDGSVELAKSKAGVVMAAMENSRYKMQTLELAPGDTLFLYTDGVTEATNEHNELFGNDRLLDAVSLGGGRGTKEICRFVKRQIDAFTRNAPQFDDITMLAMEYKGGNDR